MREKCLEKEILVYGSDMRMEDKEGKGAVTNFVANPKH